MGKTKKQPFYKLKISLCPHNSLPTKGRLMTFDARHPGHVGKPSMLSNSNGLSRSDRWIFCKTYFNTSSVLSADCENFINLLLKLNKKLGKNCIGLLDRQSQESRVCLDILFVSWKKYFSEDGIFFSTLIKNKR